MNNVDYFLSDIGVFKMLNGRLYPFPEMNEGSVSDYVELQRLMCMLNTHCRSRSFQLFGDSLVAGALRSNMRNGFEEFVRQRLTNAELPQGTGQCAVLEDSPCPRDPFVRQSVALFCPISTPGVHSHTAARPFNFRPVPLNRHAQELAMSSFHTLAVHAGERMPRPDPSTPLRAGFTPVATPIYHNAAHIYEELVALDGVFAGTREGPVYARYGNPTLTALEAAVAALEGGVAALSYASGMAPRSTARCRAQARGCARAQHV